MIREKAEELVAALRSGKYQQSRNTLKDDEGFCCLGVACEISGLGKWKKFHDSCETYVVDDGSMSDTVLPLEVKKYFGFATSNGFFPDGFFPDTGDSCLSGANDSGASFSEIADFIEKNWETL